MENLILNLLLIFLMPLLFIGIINKTKALWAGRKGAPVLQPFYDFFKRLRKGEVTSTTTTLVFQAASVAYPASVVFASLLLPVVDHQSALTFDGNFILFAYALSFGKFFTLLGAMDTGSSFEGMGASREAFFSALPEPAFFIVLGSLCLFQNVFSFDKLTVFTQTRSELGILIVLLVAAILFIILLIEGGRIPIDDPQTHLELTMIHEVMVLDNSGPSLAFIQYASAMKMVLLSVLILNFLIPAGIGIYASLLALIAGLFLIAFVIGAIESTIARLRLVRIPDFILPTLGMSLIVMFVVLLLKEGGAK